MSTEQPLVVIAGLGEGLGSGMAHFFADQGCRVIGLNRSVVDVPNNLWQQYSVDLTNEQQLNNVQQQIVEQYGIPNLLIHNPKALVMEEFEKTTAAQFQQCWQSMTLSAFLLAQTFLPLMSQQGGTMIVSGATASIRGGTKFSAFSSAKFALRGLVQSLARSYHPQGVHVVHVLLDGIIDTTASRQRHQLADEKMMLPRDIAEVYWQLSQQAPSTWTHELDLRPALENF